MIFDAGFYGFHEVIKHRKNKEGYKILLATIGTSMICVCCLDPNNYIFAQKCFCISYNPKVKKAVSLSALRYYNQLKQAMIHQTLEELR